MKKSSVSLSKYKEPKLKVGKEYWVLQQFAKLVRLEGSTAVMLNRWDQQFEVDVGMVQEKPKAGD